MLIRAPPRPIIERLKMENGLSVNIIVANKSICEWKKYSKNNVEIVYDY